MAFADRMKELRKENQFSQTEAAQLIGVAQSTYYHWENAERLPRAKAIKQIADAYGVTTTWLETGLGEKTPQAVEAKAKEVEIKKRDEHVTVYSKETEEKLRDIETVIRYIKQMDVPKERKRHIHRTLSAYRTELENLVLFGELGA